ncbi:SHOCT domain-containing protein [Ancylomarina salipaludis]|uniref:SHOCT domain-containing protein n=1 Tax=Ancylomarina salipaludis TaxID=2501299 RepID=A0A4Q1JKA0_9BACT|nr:SHOCT domain-containing protein [Ancylomarina salipaludis]RXQ90393.1 SHOCT domain-containing protein [Ancylomarina salipaludis]
MISTLLKLKTKLGFLFISSILLSSCGVIIGGSKYYAHVTVENHPKAVISYDGKTKGVGEADFLAPRSYADSFSISVKEPGCDEQIFDFTKKSFRGWALAGTLVTWTGTISGIPVPWGLIVDTASGSLWKPNVLEDGVSKIDYKNFHYSLNYTGCPDDYNGPIIKTKAERLTELKRLLDEGILTLEEFNAEKKKILSE